jgi:hypothetical protein
MNELKKPNILERKHDEEGNIPEQQQEKRNIQMRKRKEERKKTKDICIYRS